MMAPRPLTALTVPSAYLPLFLGLYISCCLFGSVFQVSCVCGRRYCYEDDEKIRFGRYGASDGSGITGRKPDGKQKDHSYNALVDDFMDAVVENWCEPANFDQAAREDHYRKQTKRFAELALKRYNKNKNNKVKYSLVEAIDGAIFPERSYTCAHVNFYANAKNGPKKNDPEVLVFAELQHVGRRVNAMALTSFHFLDEKKQTTGHRDVSRSSRMIRDIYHCMLVPMISSTPRDQAIRQATLLLRHITLRIRSSTMSVAPKSVAEI